MSALYEYLDYLGISMERRQSIAAFFAQVRLSKSVSPFPPPSPCSAPDLLDPLSLLPAPAASLQHQQRNVHPKGLADYQVRSWTLGLSECPYQHSIDLRAGTAALVMLAC